MDMTFEGEAPPPNKSSSKTSASFRPPPPRGRRRRWLVFYLTFTLNFFSIILFSSFVKGLMLLLLLRPPSLSLVLSSSFNFIPLNCPALLDRLPFPRFTPRAWIFVISLAIPDRFPTRSARIVYLLWSGLRKIRDPPLWRAAFDGFQKVFTKTDKVCTWFHNSLCKRGCWYKYVRERVRLGG